MTIVYFSTRRRWHPKAKSFAAFACCLTALHFLLPIATLAQVAPTEVNQKSTDEFGFERKTGRLSWNSGTIIQIGGETGIRLSWDERKSISSGDLPTLERSTAEGFGDFYHTVSYFADSQTFYGSSVYKSEYPLGSFLENTLDGFLFTDRQGVTIEFVGTRAKKVVYPDGREIVYDRKYHKTNFGYMIKFSDRQTVNGPTSFQAINQSIDYCLEISETPCIGLTNQRSGSISRQSNGIVTITDPQGGQTLLRGYNWVAKMYHKTTVFTPSDELRYYLEGVTLPGSSSEDLTIIYKSIDQRYDTHDDVWISSIKKNGIKADYAITRTQLGGQSVPFPSTTYSLTINATIGGQKLWHSFAVKPTSGFGRSRRVLAYIDDPLGRRTGFVYNAAVEVSSVSAPNGLTTRNEYDSRNNIIRSILRPPTGTGPDLITTYTYADVCTPNTRATCNKPLKVTDPKGNVTDYTYNSRGQILTQTLPALAHRVRKHAISIL
ncbi:MAG: hypothetical protein RLZZ157_5 [Pseudomonadota bacterium]|jgi:YD repeat-containing protein